MAVAMYILDVNANTFTWSVPATGRIVSMAGNGSAVLSTDPSLTIGGVQSNNNKVYEVIGCYLSTVSAGGQQLDLDYPISKGENIFLSTGGSTMMIAIETPEVSADIPA